MYPSIKIKNCLIVIAMFLVTFQFTLHAQDAEKQKIINTINAELESFTNKDQAKWASYWVHTDRVRRISIGSGFYSEILGWDSLSDSRKEYFASEGEGFKGSKSDFDITIRSDIAIAHFIEKSGDSRAASTIILEKHSNEWKFLEMHSLYQSTYDNTDDNIEANLNAQGYNFLFKDKTDEAIKVFTLNTELYPEAWNTWDSLAEGYMKKGDSKKAIGYYEKSLSLNPNNDGAKKYLEKLKK